MGKGKLKKFKANEQYKHVIQPSRETMLSDTFEKKGQWRSFFKNDNPIILELGCGQGDYSIGLAKHFPDKNFIGTDIKGARIYYGAKKVEEQGIPNIAFLRVNIEQIESCFAAGEVDEIWITFPDPQIKYKRLKHRLTNPQFLKRYKTILKPEGIVHLKTDSEFLHGYTLGLLEGLGIEPLFTHHDIYKNQNDLGVVQSIKTFYENIWLEMGKAITYCQFNLKNL